MREENDEQEPELGAKERAQLGQLLKAAGEQAGPLMSYALRNWKRFAMTAASAAGETSFPNEPQPGYLLKHWPVAVRLMAKSPAPKVANQLPLTGQKHEVPAPPKEKPATPEEILAIMQKINSAI
jgi:hypothetical protein